MVGLVRRPRPSCCTKIRREWVTVAHGFRDVRSRYLDKPAGQAIPERNQAKLAGSLGELDPDLKAAGYGFPTGFYVEAARRAKQPDLNVTPSTPLRRQVRDFLRGQLAWEGFAELASQIFKGLYLVGPDEPSERNAPIDYVSRLIMTATDEDYFRARDMFRTFGLLAHNSDVLAKAVGFRGDLSLQQRAGRKIERSLRHPRWIALMLVVALVIVKKFDPPFGHDEARKLFEELERHGFTLRMIWRKLGFSGLRELGLNKRS